MRSSITKISFSFHQNFFLRHMLNLINQVARILLYENEQWNELYEREKKGANFNESDPHMYVEMCEYFTIYLSLSFHIQ